MPGHTKKAMGGVKYNAKGGMKYKAKKGTKLGMQSVKYGLDNNPGVTAADPKAKFIAKDKKQAKKGMKAENTFMMGGKVNYPGKVSPDSNYDMLNKQQS